ncbi:hypothetical protein INT47_010786 [Mucor saturninus]|uniref:HCP-like protein n=1 Tax=Mucor saturninus TaxID=64648 RepID=A0A8H7QRI4_9FUNG|nr:hypothetical protein INT47_010786 [Mucor saturninus]
MLQTPPAATMTDVKVATNNTHWHQDMKKKEELRISHRLSSPLSIASPVSPQPLFNSVRNRSFSSSQHSLQSTVSDPLLDHSHLKPGQNASLLSYSTTINMYRENAKKTNNMEIQCDFAIFLVEASKRLAQQEGGDINASNQQRAYMLEAEKSLKQIAMRGHSESQYYLANMYAAGLLNKTGKADFDKSFPLFVQSAKHHHPDAAYRTAKCYEDGLGTRKDKAKAVQYYRKAATLNHPGAMYRLGLAEMKGELNRSRNIRDGHKWLKRSAEAATVQYPHALHELARLHEIGLESILFIDLKYAVSLYHEAASLGYAPSAHRLGECYEFGKLDCTSDPGLSIHYYSIAAEQQHPESCFALTAWYLVGIPHILPPSDEQAYAWAMCAARSQLPRAEYAVGYFTEMGIGTTKDEHAAMQWYEKAAHHGEKRAIQRLKPMARPTVNTASKRLSFLSHTSKKEEPTNFIKRATSFLRKPTSP